MLWPWSQGWCNSRKAWPHCDAEAVSYFRMNLLWWVWGGLSWKICLRVCDVRNWGLLCNPCNFQSVCRLLLANPTECLAQSIAVLVSNDKWWHPTLRTCIVLDELNLMLGLLMKGPWWVWVVPLLCARCLWVELNAEFSWKVQTSPLQNRSLLLKNSCG